MVWPKDAEVSSKEEAWLASTADMKLLKISNLAGKECDTKAIYDSLVTKYGQDKLTEAKVTKVTTSSCPFAAVEGTLKGGAGTIGVGAMQPSISGDGRFITYTTNFDVANTFGSLDLGSKHPVAGINLFLYDRVLGMTWQVTKTGLHGSGYNKGGASKTIEEFCCPSASSSKKRGTCKESDELKGLCCWQKPCGTPALNSDLSDDGKNIVFVSDFDFLGTNDSVVKDLEIWHYHIPTSTLLRITKTSDADLDDVFPKVSASGDRVVWVSDADYVGTNDYLKANQVWMASLTYGCSKSKAASNYMAAPDVEECCKWQSVTASEVRGASAVLTFEGDIKMMWERASSKDAFCEEFVQSVHDDLSCALGVPHALIKVTSPSTGCGDWASGSSFEM